MNNLSDSPFTDEELPAKFSVTPPSRPGAILVAVVIGEIDALGRDRINCIRRLGNSRHQCWDVSRCRASDLGLSSLP